MNTIWQVAVNIKLNHLQKKIHLTKLDVITLKQELNYCDDEDYPDTESEYKITKEKLKYLLKEYNELLKTVSEIRRIDAKAGSDKKIIQKRYLMAKVKSIIVDPLCCAVKFAATKSKSIIDIVHGIFKVHKFA